MQVLDKVVEPTDVSSLTVNEKLHIAIDRARGAGSCSYAKGCVVAQVFLLEGYSPEQVSRFDSLSNLTPGVTQLPEEDLRFLVDRGYDIQDLDHLQSLWDRGTHKTQMHHVAEDFSQFN